MNTPIKTSEIAQVHHDCLILWKANGVSFKQKDFFGLVEENHAFNYQLWLEEDKARRDDKGYEFVYHAKRKIDQFNQQRNNRMEAIDEWLYHTLQPASPIDSPVHSESPGMMIDRLSILALKAYHMHAQIGRSEVDEEHRQTCKNKWNIILLQQKQLLDCLQQLLSEVHHKTRTFRVYHQFKMYNDPTLNPEIYAKEG